MPSRIVIVGAGFVGLPAARQIKRALGDDADVVLIDEKDHFLFTPRLIDALAGGVEEKQIKTDLSLIADANDLKFIRAHVDGIDRNKKRIRYTRMTADGTASTTAAYDILVLCEGARVCYFNIPGSEQNTFCLKRIDDVYLIHDRIHHLVAQARKAASKEERSALLSFVVIGGGASGVESLVALKAYAERHCEKHAPRLKKLLSFSLLQAGPQILPGFPIAIVRGAMRRLKQLGVTLHIGDAVSCVNATCVTMGKKQPVPSALTIWAAGISPNIIPMEPEVHRDGKGSLIVDHFLRVEHHIFAAGDVVTYAEQNVTVPKNGQTAFLMSQIIAENVVRTLKGRSLVPFRYRAAGTVLWFGNIGFVDLKFITIASSFVRGIRDLLYRYRNWQITRR